ncbi:MAG TPA: hypothetical protein ENJ42_10245 [Hellea balneolensis]|uniref:Thioredoxin-like fold domain-containing protein n=1 Tax=Hellea balneolensis TaxID=287478 RepID=A0A7C5LVP1_9PROT|nr:hypothetical protein [Hellea balneolensis]
MIRFFLSIVLIFAAATGLGLARFGGIHTLKHQTEELTALMAELPYISPGISDEKVLYEISFRTCPACMAYHKTEFPKLQKMGVDTRLFMFAQGRKHTPPEERAVIAELYQNRSWQLLEDWLAPSNPRSFYATMRNIPPADGNRKRTRLVQSGQEQFSRLGDILQANKINIATPILIWQGQDGQWKVVVGNSPLTNMLIRRDLK